MRLWLKKIRINNNLTCSSVAVKCGISQEYLSMIENGKRNPSIKTAKAIAKVLGFDWTLFYIKDSQE